MPWEHLGWGIIGDAVLCLLIFSLLMHCFHFCGALASQTYCTCMYCYTFIQFLLWFENTELSYIIHMCTGVSAHVHHIFWKAFLTNIIYYCPKGYYCYSSGHNGHSSKGNSWPPAMYPDPSSEKTTTTEMDFKFLTYRNSKTRLLFIPRPVIVLYSICIAGGMLPIPTIQ